MQSWFDRVRDEFSKDRLRNLTLLGVQRPANAKATDGYWLPVLCPLCSDKSGSAGIATTGFLNCHQCGRKLDLFDWWREKHGKESSWEALKDIAKLLAFEVKSSGKSRSKLPVRMTAELLAKATHDLWDASENAGIRTFLTERKLTHPQLLEHLGVGAIAGSLVFAQRGINNDLLGSYRIYNPSNLTKWRWRRWGEESPLGFWPSHVVPENIHEQNAPRILLLEGEWDVLTAWVRCRLDADNVLAFTWTGGAGGNVDPAKIPREWKGKRIDICYDNDVYQGPDLTTYYAPDEKKMAELRVRHSNLMRIATTLTKVGCIVRLLAIPVDAKEKWGGDFRDWVDAGGENLDLIKAFEFSCPEDQKAPPKRVSFDEAYSLAGNRGIFGAQVATVEEEGLSIPSVTCVDCPMGTKPCCVNCLVPEKFPAKMIHWDQHEKDLLNCLMARSFDDEVFRVVLGKPKACTVAKLEHTEYKPGARWAAIGDRIESGSNKMMDVISVEMPTLSGTVEVHGTIHHVNKTVACFASKLVQSDNADVELGEHLADLHDLCPHGVSDPSDTDSIDGYLASRSSDLADHVTHIYGRPDIHAAVDLVSHSVTWFNLDGVRRRGWLDICIIGDTRTGKSLTARHMMEHHGLGQMFACMENVSRAGLTMGSAQRAGGMMQMRPGLFPRNNRKMLCLDEFHIMVEKGKENPMLHLQGARDNGRVSGVKVYGSHSLPASVRLITICNWARGRHDAFQFACQHLLALYGAPESVSRLDFSLAVRGDPGVHRGETEHRWDAELTRALILRAWAMKESMVHIDKEAIALAKTIIAEWNEIYAEELPLFTPGEKVFSLLRVAIAVANLTFSHPSGSIYECQVREVHVEWARQWFTKVFATLQYDQFSLKTIMTRELDRPFLAELMLVKQHALEKHEDASCILPQMFGQNSRGHWCSLLGINIFEAEIVFSDLIRKGVLESTKDSFGPHSQLAPTKGGSKLLRNLIIICEEYPELWSTRRMSIMAWAGKSEDPALVPLNINPQQLRNYLDEHIGNRPTGIRSHPSSA